MTGELASALRALRISTFHDLVGVWLRDLQRVSDKSAALFLELSRLIKLAAAGKAASVSNRGTGGDREPTTSARLCGSSDEQTGLPKHLIPVFCGSTRPIADVGTGLARQPKTPEFRCVQPSTCASA